MKFLRFLAFLLAILLVAFLVHYVVYIRGFGEQYSYDNISNALFMIGVVGFFPSLMAQLGSYKLFYGMQYALKSLVSTGFRRRYTNLSDFLVEKKMDTVTSLYLELMIASGIVLGMSIVFGMLWGRQL